jgi:hypothetical protein
MKNKRLGFGMLVMVVVFGITVTGCSTLSGIFSEPPTDDGQGGIVIIRNNTSDTSYWYDYGNDDGHSGFAGLLFEGNSERVLLRLDSTFTVYYRPMTQGERRDPSASAQRAARENKRLWQTKSVTISNDETVIIDIP